MKIMRCPPATEVILGDGTVLKANELGLLLCTNQQIGLLRAHGVVAVLNHNSDRDPDENDNGNAGFSVGSIWVNQKADTAFVLVQSMPADWKPIENLAAAYEILNLIPPCPAESVGGTPADAGTGDAEPSSQPNPDDEYLLGSSVQPAEFNVDPALNEGNPIVQLGTVVAIAHTRSGLSAKDWNALPEEDREAAIADVVADLPPPPAPAVDSEIKTTETGAAPETHAVDAAQTDQVKASEQQGGAPVPDPAAQTGEAPLAPASTDAPLKDLSLEERVLNAGLELRHDDDAHWTQAGLPNVNVLSEKVHASLTRAFVTQVLGEDFVRKTETKE